MTLDRRDRLLIGGAVAALALLLVALIALLTVRALHLSGQASLASPTRSPAAVAAEPSAAPSAGRSSASVAPSGGQSPSGAPSGATTAPSASESLSAQIAAIEAQVPPLRQLQPKAVVPNQIVDQATAAAVLQREYDAANPAAAVQAIQDLWEHLGLLPPGTDLRALELQAQQSQVIGFYDEKARTMAVVQQGSSFGPLEEMTLVHEYTHALQDQNFGLASLQTDALDQTDRDLAREALAEGDATVTMSAWALAHLTPDQLQQVANDAGAPQSQAELAKLPAVLQRLLLFPYEAGATFVGQLLQQPGGWSAVDAAYRDPPDSTAQILHPQLYLAHRVPVQVALPDVTRSLGAGWKVEHVDTLGELITQVWLAQAVDGATAIQVASGWAGDRVAGYAGPDGAWGVVWSTAWQNVTDARSFESAAGEVIRHLATGGPVAAVVRLPTLPGAGGGREAVLIASNEGTLRRLEAAIAP